jgi:hypothetical protein
VDVPAPAACVHPPLHSGLFAYNNQPDEAPMSDIQRLKAQLYQLTTEAQQGAGSLGGFRQKFGQTGAQVQALIAGPPTGLDRRCRGRIG